MASKQLVTLSGAVEQVNAKGTGVKLLGEWLNISQYHPITPIPTPGELVEVVVETTDRGQWINSLKIIGAASAGPASAPTDQRSVEIRRQVAMKAAAQLVSAFAQTHEEVRVDHVFQLADKILAWLEKGGDTTD
jgi:hypothetical protein